MWGLISLPLHRFPFFKDFFWEITTSILAKKKNPAWNPKKNLIKSDQNWSNLIKTDQIWSNLIKTEVLIRFDQIFVFGFFWFHCVFFFVQSWFGMFRLKFWAKVFTKKLKQILKSWIFTCVFPFLSVFFPYVCFFSIYFFVFLCVFFFCSFVFSWFFLCLFFSLS